MKTKRHYDLARTIAVLGMLTFTSTVFAGGPLAVCNSGEPFRWPAGGIDVPFNPDQGNLGILDNAQATQAVVDSFQAWEDVATATISYQHAGQLPIDVDVTNFFPFLFPAAPDGLSAIVYDDTGEIFDLLFGPGSGILGFAGPEWVDFSNCTILEGLSFLNGPAIDTLEGLTNVMVHEFGHYSNLAHTVVNGQLFIGVGDTSGPGDDATFGPPPFPDANFPGGVEIIATMYPFLFGGIDQGTRRPKRDDISSISQLYPEADFSTTTGSINGTIFFGTKKITGVNVIARNILDPFVDAISGISSDISTDFSQDDAFSGTYRLNGLTPDAQYAVYVDEILDGGFSTPPRSPLPGPEEFYNGANESSDFSLDIPNEFTAITANAGVPADGIDILFNIQQPGQPLVIGDDGTVEVPLEFPFCVAGQAFDSVFINSNGFITFGGAAGPGFFPDPADFLGGPARIAGLWVDLNPDAGGTVIYDQSYSTFKVAWDAVPEFFSFGANTFAIEIHDNSPQCVTSSRKNDGDRDFVKRIKIRHGELTAVNGLVGVSAGIFATSGFETEVDLSRRSRHGTRPLSLQRNAAVYELFSAGDVDVANGKLNFVGFGREYRDQFERNNNLRRASRVVLPFDSINTARKFTSISPAADDIDFFKFKQRLKAGTTLVAETLNGQVDTVMGLFLCESGSAPDWWLRSRRCDPNTAQLVGFDDDGGSGLLSRIIFEVPVDGTYALAVTFCCDYDFDGVDPGQGPPFDEGRYVLDAFVTDATVLQLTDESTQEIELGFDFPFQGMSYNSVFVNSNGYLTFGDGEIFAFFPNVPDLENGLPRVAPLWVDLDPGAGGLITASSDNGSTTISFMGVPEFFFGGSNNFSVTLDSSGRVIMSYMGMTAPFGISGLAEGGGAPGTPVDLSGSPVWPATGTTYEEFLFDFDDPSNSNFFDLDGSVLIFEP